MTHRTLVIDANVLLRAVLGHRVIDLMQRFAASVTLLAPETAFEEAHRHMAEVLAKRGAGPGAVQPALDKLHALRAFVRPMAIAEYESMMGQALARIGQRDSDDWPVLACALAADCPIWTQDRDFFGVGVATWTTALIEIYLSESMPDSEAG